MIFHQWQRRVNAASLETALHRAVSPASTFERVGDPAVIRTFAEATACVGPPPGRPLRTDRVSTTSGRRPAGRSVVRTTVRQRRTGSATAAGRCSSMVRIVGPVRRDGESVQRVVPVGTYWVRGDNVASRLLAQPPNNPTEPFRYGCVSSSLRQRHRRSVAAPADGDLGVFSEVIVRGGGPHQRSVDRGTVSHYPDDIEATIQEITGGMGAAISVPDDRTERRLVVELQTGPGRPRDGSAAHRQT